MQRPILVLVLIFTLWTTQAQQTEITPTPAPSKTPEPAVTEENSEETEEDETPVVRITEPYTQADLNVLNGNVQRPNGILWHNDMLYTVCNGDWTLYEINSRSGDTRTYIYGIRNGHSLYVEDVTENSVDLWIPDYDMNALMLVNQQRAPQTVVSNLEGPWGIDYFDEGNFLVTNLTGNNITLINRSGTATEVMSELRSPTGIVVEDDFVYFANNGSARRSIEWVSRDDILEESPSPQPLASGLQNVTGLTMGADGYLYFAYALGTRGVVGRLDPEVCREEGCSNDEIEIVLYTELAAPLAGLTISPDMRLFVHTMFRPEIYWLQLNTE